MLISKYDNVLQQYLNTSIKLSEKNKSKKGHGSLITFLSKHFINNNIIVSIRQAIQNIIVKEIKECQKFSIIIDSTQDDSVIDQLAICVRYVYGGKVYERLFSLIVCHDSSGSALFELLKKELKRVGLPLNDIVACSFDSASNMKGIYNGLQAHLKTYNPKIVYTNCMRHVLNLIMSESTTHSTLAEDLFGLVESSSVFLSNSHKRISAWMATTKVKHVAHNKFYRFQKIGANRWWSKDKALSSILNINLVEDNQKVENNKFVTFLEFLLLVNQ